MPLSLFGANRRLCYWLVHSVVPTFLLFAVQPWSYGIVSLVHPVILTLVFCGLLRLILSGNNSLCSSVVLIRQFWCWFRKGDSLYIFIRWWVSPFCSVSLPVMSIRCPSMFPCIFVSSIVSFPCVVVCLIFVIVFVLNRFLLSHKSYACICD